MCRFSLVATLMLLAISTFGQDVVILNSEDGSTTRRNGQIIEWKGDQLSLKTRTRTRTIVASRIVDVQTTWPGGLTEARKLIRTGRYQEALEQLAVARDLEKRSWVQQIITAETVQCLDATDQTEAAMTEFLKLYQHDSQTRFFHLIPLPWWLNRPYPEDGRFGARLVQSRNSLLALISSSLMLTTAQSEDARLRLEQLTTDSDSRIAQLATTQLWRREVLTADENTAQRWERQIERLPDSLRPGPLVLLGQLQSRLENPDDAVTTLMKLPILYPEMKSLSALALYRCGEILQDSGQDRLAGSIHEELFQKFPSSQFAERARQKR